MANIPIPPPHEPLKPADSDRANDVWYKYWDSQSRGLNALTTVVSALSTAVSAISTVTTSGTINDGAVVATTAGTEHTFSGIPAGIKRLTVSFSSVALSSVGSILVRLGTTTAIISSGYNATATQASSVFTGGIGSTSGFPIFGESSASIYRGHMHVTRLTGNEWVQSHTMTRSSVASAFGGGAVSLVDELGQVQIITSDTANNVFRLGKANIHWEF